MQGLHSNTTLNMRCTAYILTLNTKHEMQDLVKNLSRMQISMQPETPSATPQTGRSCGGADEFQNGEVLQTRKEFVDRNTHTLTAHTLTVYLCLCVECVYVCVYICVSVCVCVHEKNPNASGLKAPSTPRLARLIPSRH